MIRLRSLEPGKDGVQPDSLFLAYRLVADGYAINNHFRQAYDCYNRYLGIKETMLGQARRDSIRARQEAIRGRVKQEEGQVIESNNLVQNLQIEIDQQTSRHAFMRQFFSIALVALTALIALMLVRSGIRLNGYKAGPQSKSAASSRTTPERLAWEALARDFQYPTGAPQ